jgi:hypothetical protein
LSDCREVHAAKGNSRFLLETFLNAATASFGAETRLIEVDRSHILPCKEYTVCEKKGYCPIDDDMLSEIYGLIRRADVIVAATPVFLLQHECPAEGSHRSLPNLLGAEIPPALAGSAPEGQARGICCPWRPPGAKRFSMPSI